MNDGGVRVRFAPSPTGHLHIGGARTALFNWLYAQKTRGTMVLRIEDTDAERSTEASYGAILESMEWLGLDWDEGPGKEGPFGPYVQSARSVVYNAEIETLLEAGHAYHCFCTPEELDELRREALELKRAVQYDGRCRRLPEDEVKYRLQNSVPNVVRFRLPEGTTRFRDVIRGEFEADNRELDDFIIRKSDGRPTYNFAAVVDDARMQISHVIRGDDHLSNTPKQVLLYRALGYRPPKFAHLPMILGGDRSRLSKRHGATSVLEYRKRGYTPDGLVNYLALLGWSLDGKTEIFTRRALIKAFSLKRVSKNPAAFDREKLDFINAEHFQRMDPLEKVALLYDVLRADGILPPDFQVEGWGGAAVPRESGPDDPDGVPEAEATRLGVIINLMGKRLRNVSEAPRRLAYFFKDDYAKNDEAYSKYLAAEEVPDRLSALADAIESVEPFNREGIESAVRALAAGLEVKPGDLIHPCRVALTGDEVSPDIFSVIHLLGRDKSVERLRNAATR
jgi:glutamyl-tRNA synthetase